MIRPATTASTGKPTGAKPAALTAASAAPEPTVNPLAAIGAGKTGTHRAFEASLEFFLAPLLAYLRDPDVTEVMVNGPSDVYVEKDGRLQRVAAGFACEADLQAAANNVAQFVGQTLTQERPILDGRLPDGSRVCVVLGPIAAKGTQINIRRFPRASGTPEFLLQRNAITPMAMEFLLLATRAYCNIMVSGGTGSGKTTLINVLSSSFDPDERVLVIEDTRELQIQREHVVQMEARPPDAYGRGQVTIRDLFATSLRMRPDRIIIGEVRRGEALDLIQAMTSGHRGALATVHASSPYDACHRLETLAMMADVGIPLYALRRQVASAIDLLVQTDRLSSGRRLISSIAELAMDDNTQNYILSDIFRLGSGADPQLEWTGRRPRALAAINRAGRADQMKLTGPMAGAAELPE
jgi:pilus assembly protein CpaF